MLKLLLPMMSLMLILPTHSAWWTSMLLLLSLTTYSITMVNPYTFTPLTSSMNMTDLMSATLTSLSILIAAMMILASTKIILTSTNPKMFLTLNIMLMIILVLCFNANSMISFYIWFEASLIPTLLIISLWGYQPERMQAGMYLMMYTISASLPMLMLFMATYSTTSSLLMSSSLIMMFPQSMNSNFFWLMLILGFLVKLPMFSTHLWLPKAHVEAPIAGSMILAAILLKLGGYGLIRIISLYQMNLVPAYMLLSLSLYGAMITSLICLRQPDMKSLIAYSSVGHMGIMLAGIMSYSTWGMTAALMMMIAHGLCSSALFIMANISYSMTHTRSIYLTKGMLAICPSLAMWWFLLLSANMAAPPSLNLLSEIMLITSIMSISTYTMLVLAALSFFTAVYSLHLFAVTQHGQTHFMLNPSPSYKSSDMLLLMIHLVPLIALIMKSDIMLCWS